MRIHFLAVADTEGGGGVMPPLEAYVPTLPLQKSVESKAEKTQFSKYIVFSF